ncbi:MULTISPECIES: F510_1955 family glycosylhydrolase [unclassified Sporosarcina]|uniref:F510_1955 family glycosylhydrolase n=1 Tax=unclassified Sporosarcina TaxID=2647733 RepID=UPI00203FED87|nr:MULTISPECIES: sialidase [unclassified Sporosarcina]GKV66902.1 hypothetical protein NCCP2331_30550 [Sporosarcina sp. NCCP-2331]GLB57197.1 hypothetical protein NCCP2378_29850 [Sporosarcina sp. NCCP-2378]
MLKQVKLFLGLFSIIMIVSACNKASESYSFKEVENDRFEHLHGLGYINGGPEFVISTHDGLYEYGNSEWKEASSEKHDYMGFQAIREGFFSSGHPEPESDYKNPLGLIKSIDRGASFEKLAFYGEIDFHYLGAGYDSNAVYVLNEMPNDEISGGLYYTLDEGTSWTDASMNGYSSDSISNLAVHPKQEEIIAIGSKNGIYLSKDYGENFTLINDKGMVIYVTLTEDGGYYTSYDNETVELKSFSIETDQEVDIPLPDEKMDPIAFIAFNPENKKEIVIATNDNTIYLTKDEGLNWNRIAHNGKLAK